MKLLYVGTVHWTVLVAESVLAELNDWSRAKQPKIAMVSLLVNSIPEGGPQETNPIVCKPLRGTDGLFEFRKGKRHGEKVRVLWFHGNRLRHEIICVHCFVKTTRETPPEAIALA